MITNAKITSTFLGIEDHGIMTFMLHLEAGGFGIGYGGYGLDHKLKCGGGEIMPSSMGHSYQAIRNILETLGLLKWESLPGTLCRIEHDNGPGYSTKILRIGHIMEDRWFDLAAYMKSFSKENP